MRVQPTQLQNLLNTRWLQHHAQAWPKQHVSCDQFAPPLGPCTEHLWVFSRSGSTFFAIEERSPWTKPFSTNQIHTSCQHSQYLALEIFGPFYAARHIYAGIASSLLPLSLSGGILSKPQFCSLSKKCLYDGRVVYWRRWIHTRNNYWWVGWQRDARLEGRVVHMAPSANTSYDAASIVMSLLEFIHHPVAHELVHNGAMFQVFLVFLTPHVFLFPLSGNNNQDQIFFSNFVGIYFLSIFSRWLQVHGVTGGCRDILGVPVASEWCGNPL